VRLLSWNAAQPALQVGCDKIFRKELFGPLGSSFQSPRFRKKGFLHLAAVHGRPTTYAL
jgi:hypothetical protein